MTNNNNNEKDFFAEAEPVTNDGEFFAEAEDPTQNNTKSSSGEDSIWTKSEPFREGMVRGGTIGLSDDLAGTIGAVGDIIGGYGTPGPEDESTLSRFKRLFNENRNRERERVNAIEKEHPTQFMAGDIAGSMVIPYGKIAGKFGNLGKAEEALQNANQAAKTAKRAGLIQKEAKLADDVKLAEDAIRAQKLDRNFRAGTTIAAAEGAGRSENDFLSPEFNEDVINSATVGSAIPLLGAGTAKTARFAKDSLIPDRVRAILQRAREFGQEGINTKSPEFGKQVLKQTTDLAEGTADDVLARKQALDAPRQEALRKHEEKIAKMLENQKALADFASKETNSKISGIENDVEDFIKKETSRQKAQNLLDKKKLTDQTFEKAKTLQTRVEGLRKSLSNEYDEIYKIGKDNGVKVDATPRIQEFLTSLENSPLNESQIKKIASSMSDYTGEMDLDKFGRLKREIHKFTSKSNSPEVRFAAREAYKNLGDDMVMHLQGQGQEELANRLNDTNRKWRVFSNFDDFVEGINPDTVGGTPVMRPHGTTIKTIEDQASEKAKDIAENQRFQDYWKSAGLPEEDLADAIAHSQNLKANASFKPQIPAKEDLLAKNPEYQQLIQQKEAIKSLPKPELPEAPQIPLTPEEEQINKFGSSREAVIQKLLGLFPKAENELASIPRTRELENLKDILSKQKGPDASELFTRKMDDANLNREVGLSAKNAEVMKNMFTKAGKESNIFNWATGGATGIANKVGRMEANPNSLLSKFKNRRANPGRAGNIIQPTLDYKKDENTDSKKIINQSPKKLKETSMKLRSMDNSNEAQFVADKLDAASQSKNKQERTAKMFDLMQTPYSRLLLKDEEES